VILTGMEKSAARFVAGSSRIDRPFLFSVLLWVERPTIVLQEKSSFSTNFMYLFA
jgi:hypothetical protein